MLECVHMCVEFGGQMQNIDCACLRLSCHAFCFPLVPGDCVQGVVDVDGRGRRREPWKPSMEALHVLPFHRVGSIVIKHWNIGTVRRLGTDESSSRPFGPCLQLTVDCDTTHLHALTCGRA